MEDALSKNQNLLAYFAKKHDKPTVTVLMKLCYLADLIYYKKNKSQITDYEYRRYTFGPFDKNIYTDLEALVAEHSILKNEIEHGKYGEDTEIILYKFAKDEDFEVDLSTEELTVADELLSALGGKGASDLTKVAYKTKPMVKFNAEIGGTEHWNEVLDLSAS